MKALAGFALLIALVFGFFPEIDLWVSEYFYHDGAFWLKEHPIFVFFHDVLRPLLIGMVVLLFASFVYQYLRRVRLKYLNPKGIGFLLVFLLLGPGLVTNGFFKEYSGRARHIKIEHFGGTKQFTPFYQVADECEHNCSFISGHASAAFFFLAFGYLFHSRILFFLALAFGIMMALTRVVQGGHFLSDVLFAFIINVAILKGVYYLFYKRDAKLDEASL
jgi:lipid A 4'-phosphatase